LFTGKRENNDIMVLSENPLRVLSGVYDIFIGFVARDYIDGLLRGHQMSGARPIKMSYTPDQVMFAGFSDSAIIAAFFHQGTQEYLRRESSNFNY